ncbi:MAG: hypothetical protein K2X48_14895 [Chitinophagaceae bacterium]|nr:hypothetical protein [Chitinophagaceae bacterium]
MNKPNLIKIFITSSIVLSFISCSPQNQQYKIDDSVSPTVDSIFKANNILFYNSLNPKFLFHIKNTFDYEKFEDNGEDLAYILKTSSEKSKEAYLNGMSECTLKKDTINLTLILSYQSRAGILLSIFDDKFTSQLRLIGTEKIYSKTERKSDLRSEIILNPDNISLTLVEKPRFKSGKKIKGKMDVKFEPFYQLDRSNRLTKINPEFIIIFDSEIR